eukprot:900019-Karenia_brevis.AAC.1
MRGEPAAQRERRQDARSPELTNTQTCNHRAQKFHPTHERKDTPPKHGHTKCMTTKQQLMDTWTH